MLKLLINREVSCSFTGHRPSKMPWGTDEDDPRCKELKRRLFDTVEAVAHSGVYHFISGMALGCDLYFCEAVIRLREKQSHITLEAAVPWPGQADRWTEPDRQRYAKLLDACDYKTVIQMEFNTNCMMRRNRYMVDNSSVLIAVFNGSRGGTSYTISYALQNGIEIIELPISN